MPWIYLLTASIFEIIFAISMKYADGFTKFWPTIAVVIGGVGGITFLTLALKTLPVSVAYPVWTGVGIVGTVLLGYLLFNESLTAMKIISIAAILLGIAGLKLN